MHNNNYNTLLSYRDSPNSQDADKAEADGDMQMLTPASKNRDDSRARGRHHHETESDNPEELLHRWKDLAIKLTYRKKPKYGILRKRSSEIRADQGIYDDSDSPFFDIASPSLKSCEKQKLIKLPSDMKVEDKLANAERKLAHTMRTKQEKRERFTAIIKEDELSLEVLEKQLKDLEKDIEIQEDKIMAMKLEKKGRPLHKKVSAQFQIAKSLVKKERMRDERVVLKNQCASLRKRIQKYKTKIRYDLQILQDPAVGTVNPSGDQKVHLKSKTERRPIPACFFVGTPLSTTREEVEVMPSIRVEDLLNADSNQLCIASKTRDAQVTSEENLIGAHSSGSASEENIDKERLGCKWRFDAHETKDIGIAAKSTNREFESSSSNDGGFNADWYTSRHGLWLARNRGSSSEV